MISLDQVQIKPGYLYILKNNVLGGYKIGITTAPKSRFKALSVGNKANLVAYWELEYFREIEKYLHSTYTEHRVPQSEWFDLNVIQVCNIITMLNTLSSPEFITEGWDVKSPPKTRLQFVKQPPYQQNQYANWYYFGFLIVTGVLGYLIAHLI